MMSSLFFVSFLVLCSRGLFENAIGKGPAYVLQAGLWTIMVAVVTLHSRQRPTRYLAPSLTLTFLFGAVAVVSSYLTLASQGFSGAIIAALINVYLLLLFVVGQGIRPEDLSARSMLYCMAFTGLLLTAVGVLQLANIFELPGRSWFRPPSLTGSYLHFPLLEAAIGAYCVQGAVTLRMRWLYLVAVACFVGVVISGGRSGALIVFITALIYVVIRFFELPGLQKVNFALGIGTIVGVLSVAIAIAYESSEALQHIGRLGDLQDTGNAERVETWTWIYDNWSSTNLWLGEYAGLVGNITGNLTDTPTRVAESGVLEQIMNFGVIGFLLFYSVMLMSFWSIERSSLVLRSALIAALVQSSFYQSTEVFPFMAMIAFMPTFSWALKQASGASVPELKLRTSPAH